jgi:hypothetical protein
MVNFFFGGEKLVSFPIPSPVLVLVPEQPLLAGSINNRKDHNSPQCRHFRNQFAQSIALDADRKLNIFLLVEVAIQRPTSHHDFSVITITGGSVLPFSNSCTGPQP